MKKFSFFILVLGLVACSNEVAEVSESSTKVIAVEAKAPFKEKQTVQKDIREKVWEQLSKPDQERINGTWSDGAFMKRVLKEGMCTVKDPGKKYDKPEKYGYFCRFAHPKKLLDMDT